MASYDKVADFCKAIDAKFSERTENSGICEIKQKDTFLIGWKDSERVDLEKRGIDFVFDLKEISCLPNIEAGCFIRGKDKEKEAENIDIDIFVDKLRGLTSGSVRFETKTKSFPIMTIFGD